MALRHTTGAALDVTSDYLAEIGTFHLMCTHATDVPTKKDGTPMVDAKWQVTLEVLAGTVAGQEKKTIDITAYSAKPDATEFGRKADQAREDRTFLALGLLPIEAITFDGGKLGLREGVEFDIEISDAIGRQLICRFPEKRQNDPRYLATNRAEAFHVDDPAVKAVPKNEATLKAIPAALRWVHGQPKGVKATKAAATTPVVSSSAPAAGSAVAPSEAAFNGV